MTLNVNGSMDINGALSMTDATGVINVKRNWYNSVGAVGFTAGPGKVVFNGRRIPPILYERNLQHS